jgi:superfamily II DNA or RNA helicase
MLLALRQETVRLLIADDVGIGKTIEAALTARELLDRGEERRLCVICPPHLCDQWQAELAEKFHIEAEVVRSGTIAQLERRLPRPDLNVFEYYPHLVVSVDFAKSDRRRAAFLLHCPDLVIVDEVHTCARPGGRNAVQQQRHDLMVELAKKKIRHLLLLTATPHSGIEESFLSILGLLKPEFDRLNLDRMDDEQREELARHFIQRRRADVKSWLGEDTPFPEREPEEKSYGLSAEYRKLFEDVYAFARELVQSGEALGGFRQRVRYWTALALLRCVMSSPAAANAALLARLHRLTGEPLLLESEEEVDEGQFVPYIFDPTELETSEDVAPTHVVEEGETTLPASERRRLRDFSKRAAALRGDADEKVKLAAEEVKRLLEAGLQPIVYCRYIATADYVAGELARRLERGMKDLRVLSVTGALSDEERKQRVEELGKAPRRVLVATDCLSEGVNLQDAFSAVIHYDLPWNPNRLEQREGRVDRFGQVVPKVKTLLLYGRDNPIDGVVLDVLIRKAVRIHRTLGVSVPLPANSETVMEAVLKALFMRGGAKPSTGGQLSLDLDLPMVTELHREWDRAVDREEERLNRTRYAQRTIHPGDVQRELEETDAVLGEPKAVEEFVRAACERLNAPLQRTGKYWRLEVGALPLPVRERLDGAQELRLAFDTPVPEGVVYVGRNHPLTAGLAAFLLDGAFDPTLPQPPAARSGVIRTTAVERRTMLLLLRIRFLLEDRAKGGPLLAEELVVVGLQGRPESIEVLSEAEALRLVKEAEATENISLEDRERLLRDAMGWLPALSPHLESVAKERAQRLLDAHRRVRKLTEERLRGFTVRPHLPVDVLGLYVLMPVPKGVSTGGPVPPGMRTSR